MARPKKPKRRRSDREARALSQLSDEELGRWVAGRERRWLEPEICKSVGVDAIYTLGRGLLDVREHKAAREMLDRVTGRYFDFALQFNGDTPEFLAVWLALSGDYERAGQAFRHSPGMRRVQGEQAQAIALGKGRESIGADKLARESRWAVIGRAKREAERGRRQSNRDLAQEIWNDCPRELRRSVSTITQAVPRLGLDKRKWDREHPVRPARAADNPRIVRTFGTKKPSRFGNLRFGKSKTVPR